MSYASLAKRAECARKACKRFHRRHHREQLERAARYRQANRKAVAQRQQQYIKRKLAEDPTYRVRMICQTHWKARCDGDALEQPASAAGRVESRQKWIFSKDELQAYKDDVAPGLWP
jgi:hypothetical protein